MTRAISLSSSKVPLSCIDEIRWNMSFINTIRRLLTSCYRLPGKRPNESYVLFKTALFPMFCYATIKKIIILALRLELVSSLPDCRGLFALIRVHVVMPGRRARALTSGLYCCVSIVTVAVSFDNVHPSATHTCL